MNQDHVKKSVVKNAVSSYVRTVVRLVLGLITFRMLFQNLTPEQYGFWALLWAVFGYGILLDFGFGYSAQKRVAELSVKQDWPQLSRVLSTIFFFYALGALVAVSLGIIFSGPLIDLFKVSLANREEYRHIMIIFLLGIGVAFPFGIFPEVLQGQQRASVWNNIFIVSTAINFIVIVTCLLAHWSFMVLVLLSLLSFLLPYFLAAMASMKFMPEVRIRPNLFAWHTIVETSKFSLYAYANTLGNTLRNKTDQPVISAILGVAFVKPYQAGSKVGEMFDMFTRQFGDVLASTAAHLHAKGDATELRRIMIRGMRFSTMVGTPLYILCAGYMDGVLRILTGQKTPSGPMVWAGELLVFWYYSMVITHAVFKNMSMMAGQEKRMMRQGVAEAVLNLILSIGFTFWFRHAYGRDWGILGVALGSVVPTFIFGWGWLWGWAAEATGLSRWELFRQVVLRSWLSCLPMLAVAILLREQPLWASGSNTALVLGEGAVTGCVGLWGIWRFGLDHRERSDYAGRIRSKLSRKKAGAA